MINLYDIHCDTQCSQTNMLNRITTIQSRQLGKRMLHSCGCTLEFPDRSRVRIKSSWSIESVSLNSRSALHGHGVAPRVRRWARFSWAVNEECNRGKMKEWFSMFFLEVIITRQGPFVSRNKFRMCEEHCLECGDSQHFVNIQYVFMNTLVRKRPNLARKSQKSKPFKKQFLKK